MNQKDAIWQFFLDHAVVKIKKDGHATWYVSFPVRNENDFWQRVSMRQMGDYKVVNVNTAERKMEKVGEKLNKNNQEILRLKSRIKKLENRENLGKMIFWIKNYFIKKTKSIIF